MDITTLARGWTIETYAAHIDALREADIRYMAERDRRYTEVALEREKALKIKETADLAALGLAREIQTYKDEKANQLREQINSERGHYATKDDLAAVVEKLEATIKPLADFVSRQQGNKAGMNTASGVLVIVLTLAVSMSGVIAVILTH